MLVAWLEGNSNPSAKPSQVIQSRFPRTHKAFGLEAGRGTMRWLVPLLLLYFVIPDAGAEAPADELCVITFLPNREFSQVVVRADEVYNDSRKQELAREIDTDQDGQVNAGEAREYENASVTIVHEWYNASQFRHFHEKRLFVDDKAPREIMIWTDLTGVLGATGNTTGWLITEVRTYSFQEERLSTHRIQGGENSSREGRVVIEFVLVKAPKGWLVHRVNETLFDTPEASLPRFDVDHAFKFDFSQRPGEDYTLPVKGDPGLTSAWSVGALLSALVFVAMRRRR